MRDGIKPRSDVDRYVKNQSLDRGHSWFTLSTWVHDEHCVETANAIALVQFPPLRLRIRKSNPNCGIEKEIKAIGS